MINPTYAAERVLTDLGITKPGDLRYLELIAWARGALVRRKHLDGAEARLTILSRRAIITVSSTVANHRRVRFSIAHELGHLEIHRLNSKLTLCAGKDIDDESMCGEKVGKEQEANQFASALLLPKRFFEPLCADTDPSLELVEDLAGTFDVSLTTTAIRYMNFCEAPCAVVFSQGERVRWFESTREFKDLDLFIKVRSHLAPSSVAASLHRRGSLQKMSKRVRASTWFIPGQYREDAEIMEQSLWMPNHDAVLTLLWVDEDIEADDDLW